MAIHEQDNAFGTMGREIRRKLRRDDDAHVLVVGRDSATGIGKSTFAIQFCRYLDLTDDEWSAEEKGCIEIDEYIEKHMKYPKGSALLLDEIEAGADSRRATSHENVNLSQAWATMRAQNIATVATLPSVSMLDNRMLELADYWVLIKSRGLAQPYRIKVNDFNGKVQRKPISADKHGNGEHIQFPDLPSGDPDKKYLDDIKDETVMSLTSSAQKVTMSEHKKKLKKAQKDTRLETRNKLLKGLYESTDMSTTDISNIDGVNISQQQVANIVG